MKKIKILGAFLLGISLSLQAQVTLEQPKLPVTRAAFNKLVSQNFSYLLLSENSPQQGISATLNDKGSNLKINGLLYSGALGIFTMEADLGSTNGVYFFDQEKGGSQAKISFNFYRSLLSLSKYNSADALNTTTNRLALVELIIDAKSKYDTYYKLLSDQNVLNTDYSQLKTALIASRSEVIQKLQELSARYINEEQPVDLTTLPTRSIDTKSMILPKSEALAFEADSITYTLKATGYNLSELLSAFRASEHYILEQLEDDLIDLELKNAESQWGAMHNTFFSLTGFYERESFRRFTLNRTQSFSDMFDDTKGDLFGLTASINYNYERKKECGSCIRPYRFFIKGAATVGRASNRSSFANSTLNFTDALGTDVNGNPIVFTKEDAAFIGDTSYEYAPNATFQIEAYYYPFKLPVGFFGRLGYSYVNFGRLKNIKDIELTPMRLGLLFNLKNKEENKPIVTVQTFLDRTDLSLSPNGRDNDLRFGLGVGLPINIR